MTRRKVSRRRQRRLKKKVCKDPRQQKIEGLLSRVTKLRLDLKKLENKIKETEKEAERLSDKITE